MINSLCLRVWSLSLVSRGNEHAVPPADLLPGVGPAGGWAADAFGASPGAGVRAKLATKIDLEKGIDPNTPLKDALDFLAERGKITLRIDEKGFQQIGVQRPQDTPVVFPRMKAATVGLVLEVIMYQIAGDRFRGNFVVRKDHVLLVPGFNAYSKEIDRDERASPLRYAGKGHYAEKWDRCRHGFHRSAGATTSPKQGADHGRGSQHKEKVATSPVKLVRQGNVPLGTVLRLLLNQVKAGDAKLAYRVHRYWVEIYQK